MNFKRKKVGLSLTLTHTHTQSSFDNAFVHFHNFCASLFLFCRILYFSFVSFFVSRLPREPSINSCYLHAKDELHEHQIKVYKNESDRDRHSSRKREKNACSKIYLLLFYRFLFKCETNYLDFCVLSKIYHQNEAEKERE